MPSSSPQRPEIREAFRTSAPISLYRVALAPIDDEALVKRHRDVAAPGPRRVQGVDVPPVAVGGAAGLGPEDPEVVHDASYVCALAAPEEDDAGVVQESGARWLPPRLRAVAPGVKDFPGQLHGLPRRGLKVEGPGVSEHGDLLPPLPLLQPPATGGGPHLAGLPPDVFNRILDFVILILTSKVLVRLLEPSVLVLLLPGVAFASKDD
mmetsp:Transcript_82477/g.218867  ORF Transcript_82477/g.218867 Transcript_82477/m.218867 type:complete len:208 (+) Transcript_82477:898-1521(+)